MSGAARKTAERIDPEHFDTREEYLLYLRHAFAYEFTKARLKPADHVLEVGSGEGYGTRLLAEVAERLIGLDIDEGTVAHAAQKYGCDKIQFRIYDGQEIPFRDASFTAAVSFQVIEHVRNDAKHVSEIRRVLKPGGTLVLTTPNRNYRLKPGQKPWNRFHIREYDPQGLKSTLERNFRDVSVWGICGSDEVQSIEKARVAWALRGGPVSAIRRSLPEPVKVLAGATLNSIHRIVSGRKPGKDFIGRYGVNDFHVTTDRVEDSLDLLAVCRA